MTADRMGRNLRDLRISVTDRCNFRCTYCMPAERTYTFLPRAELLTFEEITKIARIFAGLGVVKLRITGGEPLLRRDLTDLIAMLAGIDGIEDIALTTNGFLLPQLANPLRQAGLHRVTVSLDSLVPETLTALSGRLVSPQKILEAIRIAKDVGLAVKVNTVLQRGVNDGEILDLVRRFRDLGVVLRFIEFMDVGTLNQWAMTRVVPSREVLDQIHQHHPLEPVPAAYSGEVAKRYRFLDGKGEIGFISSVTQAFCGGCTRARLSAKGELFTCLFSASGSDLKTVLRQEGEAAVKQMIEGVWRHRSDRYSELRLAGKREDKVEMYHVGG